MTVVDFFNLIHRCKVTCASLEFHTGVILTGEQKIQIYTNFAKDYDGVRARTESGSAN